MRALCCSSRSSMLLVNMTSIVSYFKRTYKRSVLLVGFLATLAIVATIQYINDTQSRRLLIYNNSSRNLVVTTTRYRTEVVDAKLNPKFTGTKGQRINDSFVLKITPKPNLKRLINATKTQYPVTINAPYVMENPHLCTSVRNLSVLVIVHSAPSHFERRQAMRDTWTNDTLYANLGRARVLFLLGRVKKHELQVKLEQEFIKHGDLLQGDFIDAYRNLTHKGVMGYKWISEKCTNAKVVLKVDDDIVVNMFKLFTDYIPKYKSKSKQIMCNHIFPGTMLIIRDKTSKWHVDENHFKGQKFYPRYCSGFMVMITNDVIPAIYRSAKLTPFFWVDDVYLYGLAPGNVPGIHYTGLRKGSHQLNGQAALKCYRNSSRTCNFLVAGAGKRDVMVEIWSNMVHLHEQFLKNRFIMATHLSTKSITDSVSFEQTKSMNQLNNEQAKLDTIMEGKNLIIGKLVNKLETSNVIV